MKSKPVLARGVVALLLLVGCSSTDKPSPAGASSGGQSSDEGVPSETPATGNEAPSTGGATDDYPAGPYGTKVGTVIANLDLVGRVSFDDAASPAIGYEWKDASLNDVRKSGKKYALIFLPAIWCTPCRPNAEALAAEAKDVNARGGLIVQILVDGSPPDTAPTKANADTWVKTVSSNFTTLIDPPGKPLRTKEAFGWDYALVVDLSTMKIAYTGAAKSALGVLKQKLGP